MLLIHRTLHHTVCYSELRCILWWDAAQEMPKHALIQVVACVCTESVLNRMSSVRIRKNLERVLVVLHKLVNQQLSMLVVNVVIASPVDQQQILLVRQARHER